MQPDGSLCQFGSDEDIILNPANRFVFEFIGVSNFIPVVSDGGKLCLDCGEKIPLPKELVPAGENIAGKEMGVRLNDVVFEPKSPLRATVKSRVFLGSEYNYFLQLGQKEIRVQQDMLAARLYGTPEEGEETGITFINPHFYDPKPPQKTVSADTGAKKKKFSLFGKGA